MTQQAVEIDETREFTVLHDALEAAVDAARQRYLDAEDACAMDEGDDADETERSAAAYHAAAERLDVALTLLTRVEQIDVDSLAGAVAR